MPGFVSYPASTTPSLRGGLQMDGPDGFFVTVTPEPRLENTIFDGRTAAEKKADGPPVPTPPGLVYKVENRIVEEIVTEEAPAADAAAPAAPGAVAPVAPTGPPAAGARPTLPPPVVSPSAGAAAAFGGARPVSGAAPGTAVPSIAAGQLAAQG